MMRQFTRVDTVRQYLDAKILENTDLEERRCAYVHLYGVGMAAAMLAFKRGKGKKIDELAEVAGMLHDCAKYLNQPHEDRGVGKSHAVRSAILAEKLLFEAGEFTEEEIALICTAISKHSDKDRKDSAFDEILKDADKLQHWLRNPMEEYWYRKENCESLAMELGLNVENLYNENE